MSEKVKKKQSLSLKNYYLKYPAKRQKIIECLKKHRCTPKGSYLSDEHKRKILKSLFKRPTSFEQKIIDLCKNYNLPYKYVGDGEVIIGYVNPDFINTNHRKF